jgi:CubicO group peptidase (beta-lactamase class C family)
MPKDGEMIKAEQVIKKIMKKGKIPGACIVVVRKGKEDEIECFGYADVKKKIPVTPAARFELASCTKSFTGLAVLQLEKKKLINLNDPVSKYFPGFYAWYNDEKFDLTINQLLRHTSGIPWEAVSLVTPGNSRNSLKKIVKNANGIQLTNMPGERLGYSSINYDILGAIIEKVTGKSFEEYMGELVLKPLKLNDTSVGVDKDNPLMASGYKTGLFFPGKYDAPVFRGNNPAAYIISNGKDVARWLKLQMGLEKTAMASLIKKTQKPAKNPSYGRWQKYAYAAGWIVRKEKAGEVFHTGFNPTFTCYIGFKPKEKTGVAVLVNSNSFNTLTIADYVMGLISGERRKRIYLVPFFSGKYSSVVSILLGSYLIFALHWFVSIISGIFGGVRRFTPLNEERSVLLFLISGLFIAVLTGFYLYPGKFHKVNWRTRIVWSAKSFLTAVILFLLSTGLSYALVLLLILFPS